MCVFCADPVQTQQEIVAAVSVFQVLGSVPILGIIAWQFKRLVQAVKELKGDLLQKMGKVSTQIKRK